MGKLKNVSLRETLREIRILNGFTQGQVSELLNITRSTYAYYETGKTEPNRRSIGLLSKIYGVGVDYFVFDEKPNVALKDIKFNKEVDINSNIAKLTSEERMLIAKMRLVSPKTKRKIRDCLDKEVKLLNIEEKVNTEKKE